MTDTLPKVLYIAGFARCGSTLLGSMLGQIQGFFNVGEMRMIWDRGLTDDRACGCGEPFSRCPAWGPIVARFEGALPQVDRKQMADFSRELTRSKRLPRMLVESRRRLAVASQPDRLETLRRLYQTVADETGSPVLVDTSKAPMYAYALRAAGLDVTVVHVVRDPRAVALSRLKPKRHPDTGGEMGGVPIANSALMWNLVNWAVELVLGDEQYIRIGYRQFIEDPSTTVTDIVQAVGLSAAPGLEIQASGVSLGPTHTVFGNPGRFTTGRVELRLDERWITELSPAQARLVATLTAPLRRRYAPQL